jgi:6-pyruvoyltetrahydropterin/6-carboxytetrahydropterin synthase
MKLELYTESYFSSAHILDGYPGKCSQLHGHTWKVCVWVRGDESDLDDVGILWDFSNLDKTTDELDHRYINDIVGINPTAENITVYIYKELKKDSSHLDFRIRVYESIVKKESYCEAGDF